MKSLQESIQATAQQQAELGKGFPASDEQEEESMRSLAEKVAGSLTPALRQAIARRVEGRKKAARS